MAGPYFVLTDCKSRASAYCIQRQTKNVYEVFSGKKNKGVLRILNGEKMHSEKKGQRSPEADGGAKADERLEVRERGRL